MLDQPSPRVRTTCPECGHDGQISRDKLGSHVRCPQCQARFQAVETPAVVIDPPVVPPPRRSRLGLLIIGSLSIAALAASVGYFVARSVEPSPPSLATQETVADSEPPRTSPATSKSEEVSKLQALVTLYATYQPTSGLKRTRDEFHEGLHSWDGQVFGGRITISMYELEDGTVGNVILAVVPGNGESFTREDLELFTLAGSDTLSILTPSMNDPAKWMVDTILALSDEHNDGSTVVLDGRETSIDPLIGILTLSSLPIRDK